MNAGLTEYKIKKLITQYKKQHTSAMDEYFRIDEDEETEITRYDMDMLDELDAQIGQFEHFIIDLESLLDE